MLLPLVLAATTSAAAQEGATSTWHWSCRVMAPAAPGIDKTGQLRINFDRTADAVFIEIVSDDFPQFAARRQARIAGSVKDEVDIDGVAANPAWVVETASGRRAIEVISHGSRNGGGTGILISSYEMTTIAGLPEDFFEYHAVGLCSQSRRGA
ncbi:MAG TPA: hypothetical protein VI168_06330 [Croceibacterium sp.]